MLGPDACQDPGRTLSKTPAGRPFRQTEVTQITYRSSNGPCFPGVAHEEEAHVKPAPLRYLAPRSVDEAVAMLAEHEDAKVLAGGQSLIPVLNMRLASPAVLIDINHVEGLDALEVSDAGVRVGATVRHAGLEADGAAYERIPLLRQALRHVAHPAIRNRGTTVGSIAHADPAGEMPAILTLLRGNVRIVSARGERTVDAGDFFQGPMEADLEPDELVTHVTFPATRGLRGAYDEVARRSGDYALCGVGATVLREPLDDDRAPGPVVDAAVSFVSTTAVPTRLDLTAAFGDEPGGVEPDWDAIDALVAGHVEPEADLHATADYRRHLAVVLTRRVLAAALRPHRATPEGAKR